MSTNLPVLRGAVISGLVVGGLTLGATAAFANVSVYYGSNYASANGAWVEACDMERDGNGVYGEFILQNGSHHTVWDSNGSQGGCGNAIFDSNVRQLRVCEDHSGCSDWAYV